MVTLNNIPYMEKVVENTPQTTALMTRTAGRCFRDLVPGRNNHEKGEMHIPIIDVFDRPGKIVKEPGNC